MHTLTYKYLIRSLKLRGSALNYYFWLIVDIFNFYNSTRKGWMKRYVYTINHKQIAINYLYFSMFTGLSGAALATFMRMELAMPGSLFFRESLRYLQVITAHGLIMVFVAVVPIFLEHLLTF